MMMGMTMIGRNGWCAVTIHLNYDIIDASM